VARSYIGSMAKRVVDLSAKELENAAGEAWAAASREALARGLPVIGSHDGRRLRYHPDGHVEDLGPIDSQPATEADRKSHKSVA
jgi:hypothetical protein